jgi:DNA-binding NarL/FixJ family response regulator
MPTVKIVIISAHRQLAGNFALLSKGLRNELDITTIVTNFIAGFDPNLTLKAKPDLIMLSVGLPGLDGLAIVRSIRSVNCKTPILVCCSCYAKAEFDALINYDIQGITTTNDSPEELAAAIYDVVNQEPGIFERQYRHARQTMPQLTQADEQKLSKREISILQLIAEGLRDEEIANELNVSHSCVRNSLQNIFNKLGPRDRTAAVLHAISKGILYQPPYPKRRD